VIVTLVINRDLKHAEVVEKSIPVA